jgi:hypothetical protein
MAASVSSTNTNQVSGASYMFVFDVKNWDASTGLSVPGNSAQPRSPHYADLAPRWGEGQYFPLAFSRAQVEANTKDRLMLQPLREFTAPTSAAGEPQFRPVQPDLFDDGGAQTTSGPITTTTGSRISFVGPTWPPQSSYHNDGGGTFTDVAAGRRRRKTRAAMGRFNGDGQMDLYVASPAARGSPAKAT